MNATEQQARLGLFYLQEAVSEGLMRLAKTISYD